MSLLGSRVGADLLGDAPPDGVARQYEAEADWLAESE